MPSRREGFGLVALEALEMGTPILVSSTSGIGEFLRGFLGDLNAQHHVVETVDDASRAAAEWAKHIEIVLRDREAAFARAKKLAGNLTEGRSWASTIVSLLRAIESVV